MSVEKLAYKANKIGKFFESQNPETAVVAIAEHLRLFWAPAMRARLLGHIDAVPLAPLVRQAVELLRAPA